MGRMNSLVLGRTYELREVFVQVLEWNGQEFITIGKSENLFGTGGHYTRRWGASGEKTWRSSSSVEIGLSFINGWKMVWSKVWEGKSPGGRGHRDSQGGPDLLVITDVARGPAGYLVEGLSAFSWTAAGWRKVGETAPSVGFGL